MLLLENTGQVNFAKYGSLFQWQDDVERWLIRQENLRPWAGFCQMNSNKFPTNFYWVCGILLICSFFWNTVPEAGECTLNHNICTSPQISSLLIAFLRRPLEAISLYPVNFKMCLTVCKSALSKAGGARRPPLSSFFCAGSFYFGSFLFNTLTFQVAHYTCTHTVLYNLTPQ